VVCGVLATLVDRLLDRRRPEREAPAPTCLTAELLERWRVGLVAAITKTRVGDGGQLARMVRQGDPVDVSVARVDHDSGRPRVRIGGRLLPWSEIVRRWETSHGRLVILGDPGYGKTVAALSLVKHINAHDKPGAGVAELFSLAEWQRWNGQHPQKRFGDWLAEQLTVMHPGVPAQVARELVDARLIVPVLDGLDEIATVQHRRACVAAIDAYAERGEPHRSFVLTCRAREYRELAPDWVRDDECVVLVGLQRDQIKRRLDEQTAGRPGWHVVRERQAGGDSAINELLASPLRLAIALQVYRDGDPGELLELTVEQARGRLWELLLETDAAYCGATGAQIRVWLGWLATGMRRTGRQRFMLHELYLLDERSPPKRAFRVVYGLVFGLVVGLVFVLSGGPTVGGLVSWLVVGLACGLVFDPAPSVRTQVTWRARMRQVKPRKNLVVALAFGLFVGLSVGLSDGWFFGGWEDGLVFGAIFALLGGLLGVVYDIALAGTEGVGADPAGSFAHAGPDAVLIASRTSGLVGGLVVWLGLGLFVGLTYGLIYGLFGGGLFGGLTYGLFYGLIGGLFYGLVVGLIGGLDAGLDAWAYHHWLRWRLRARGVLPARLPSFLEWCAHDERNWLRITDAYEFRHRELLEHLAPSDNPRHCERATRSAPEG
jgi:hypothetical protein